MFIIVMKKQMLVFRQWNSNSKQNPTSHQNMSESHRPKESFKLQKQAKLI